MFVRLQDSRNSGLWRVLGLHLPALCLVVFLASTAAADDDSAEDDPCACPPPIAVIDCFESVTASTETGVNESEAYQSESSWCDTATGLTGPEVMVLVGPVIPSAEIIVGLDDLEQDLDLIVLRAVEDAQDCDLCSCSVASTRRGLSDEVAFTYAAPGTYLPVVVDGFDGAASSFTLSAICEAPCFDDDDSTPPDDDDDVSEGDDDSATEPVGATGCSGCSQAQGAAPALLSCLPLLGLACRRRRSPRIATRG
jgi:hypothetical protein